MSQPSAEILRLAAFDEVAQCRKSLKEDRVNLSGLEESVRSYCMAVAGLPAEQRLAHEKHLKALMLEIEALNVELKRAHDFIGNELAGLGRMKQANLAYNKSDSIGHTHKPKKEQS